jgi:hypothetical protein
MPNLQNLTLEQALPQVEPLFKSFCVKAALVRKNEEWISIATVLQLTRRTVEDLNKEFMFLEEKLGRIDEENFKIILQSRPIKDFKEVVKELYDGKIRFGGISAKILVNLSVSDLRFGRYLQNISRIGEYAEYDFYMMSAGSDPTQFNLALTEIDRFVSSTGFRDRDELVRSYLDMEGFYQYNSFFVLVPIYVTVGEIQYQGGNEIKVTAKIDESLFDKVYVWVTRSPQGDRAPVVERKRYEISSCENVLQDGFFYVTIRHKFSAIGVNDKVSVSLSKSAVDLLCRREGITFPFPPETSDPFIKTFYLFDAGKKMEDHLLDPKDSDDLVSALTWLLEMIGIEALKMGRDEYVREEKSEKGSADIIACYRDSSSITILAIDCTMGVPDEHKIDKIKNTSDFISRKIAFPVKPVIVTSERSRITKELGLRYSVRIIDCGDLDKMIGFYRKNHTHPSRQVLFG